MHICGKIVLRSVGIHIVCVQSRPYNLAQSVIALAINQTLSNFTSSDIGHVSTCKSVSSHTRATYICLCSLPTSVWTLLIMYYECEHQADLLPGTAPCCLISRTCIQTLNTIYFSCILFLLCKSPTYLSRLSSFCQQILFWELWSR